MVKKKSPRLPLEGYIDLSYRCNNRCRHCWLNLDEDDSQKNNELSLQEIRKITDEARSLGTQRWSISGGEPMLREDFAEIFDLLTRKAVTYTLNTNGTLITPKIARLMRRRGSKMVALYGATEEVHDRITRNPGSYEALMKGVSYLKEVNAGFIIQIIPMRSNWHQYDKMIELAESLSSSYRIGSAWLYLSAYGSDKRNREIKKERLSPEQVIQIDPPNPAFESPFRDKDNILNRDDLSSSNDQIFKSCISSRRDFHIDPYGGMSFCSYIRDPAYRYDLRQGTVNDAWEHFIPSLADQIHGGNEYIQNCGSCEYRRDCRWCGVYAYLEHRRFSARINYLCDIAKETNYYKNEWKKTNRRFYQIGGITIQLDSDLAFTEKTFSPKFRLFEKKEKGMDTIHLCLHFQIPDLKGKNLGQEVYRKPPLAIYKHKNAWIYLGISPEPSNHRLHRVAVFTPEHSRGDIYIDKPGLFAKGGLDALSLFSSDQVLLARILARRKGFSIHAAGVIMAGEGLLFIGPSEAGKSTMVNLLKDEGEVLCDEYIIVRKHPDGFRIYGTWSHGDIPLVSPADARLKALLFLEKSTENQLEPITDKSEVIKWLLPRLLKPLITSDWWSDILGTVEELVREVPAYKVKFDTSGKIRQTIWEWLKKPNISDTG